MAKLPSINSQEFDLWLKNFFAYDLSLEEELVFIDLFQNGSRFADGETLWDRIEAYINIYPRRKKMVARVVNSLLCFLCDKSLLDQYQCRKERRKILGKLNPSLRIK